MTSETTKLRKRIAIITDAVLSQLELPLASPYYGRGIYALGCLLVCIVLGGWASGGDDRPNVVLIMADDMGYSDIGCYGGEIATPNLDLLAEGGMRFRQFYNAAKCSPTRAELLCGQYAYVVGVRELEHGATFGEVLGAAGYRTIISGKWHQKPLPTTRGFDRYFGLADGCCNFFNPGIEARPGEGKPGRKIDKARRWAIEGEEIFGYTNDDKDFYTTNAFTDYAVDRLQEYKNEAKPFILYLPYTAPHYPLHAWPEDIAKYRGKYKDGWDVLREQRFERMKKMGLIDADVKLSPRDEEVQPWDSLSDKEKDAEELNMAVYAAMIDRMDQGIGKVVDKLKEIGKYDNTLIMFLTDNGGCAETPNRTPDIPPGPVESYRALGPSWANATNTPYRKFKSSDYQGGNCTPFIAHWAKVIKPGTMTDQVGHVIDILPTLMEMSGVDYPKELDGRKTKPVVGKSLLPVLLGKTRESHKALYWKYNKAKAIRQGDWKLVKYDEADWELYDLVNDRTELSNLASQHPDKVKKMASLWYKWDENNAK